MSAGAGMDAQDELPWRMLRETDVSHVHGTAAVRAAPGPDARRRCIDVRGTSIWGLAGGDGRGPLAALKRLFPLLLATIPPVRHHHIRRIMVRYRY